MFNKIFFKLFGDKDDERQPRIKWEIMQHPPKHKFTTRKAWKAYVSSFICGICGKKINEGAQYGHIPLGRQDRKFKRKRMVHRVCAEPDHPIKERWKKHDKQDNSNRRTRRKTKIIVTGDEDTTG